MCAVDFGCISVVDGSGNVDTGCTLIKGDSKKEETSVNTYIKKGKMLRWWWFSKTHNSCSTAVFYSPVDMSLPASLKQT